MGTKYTPTDEQNTRNTNNFTYHPPKDADQVGRYDLVRHVAHHLADVMNENCPPSRELSLALTNVEQAVMWANAAIARNE